VEVDLRSASGAAKGPGLESGRLRLRLGKKRFFELEAAGE